MTSFPTLLLVEDDLDLMEVLRLTFQKEGYKTLEATDGVSALHLAKKHVPDLAILDVMLPGKDGIELCRDFRSDSDLCRIPVIMCTAKGEESDVVLGLGIGADDYVVKPFRPRELIARVKALLRRNNMPSSVTKDDGVIRFQDLYIDSVRFEVRLGDEKIVFTPTEFIILKSLVSKPGRVFRRFELLELALGRDALVEERNVDTHVKAIRKKLGSRGKDIETVRGVGYRFAE